MESSAPPEVISSQLVDMVVGRDLMLAVYASRALEGRYISETDMRRLKRAHDRWWAVEPRGPGDTPYAWVDVISRALVAGVTYGKSQEERIEALIAELRHSRPFGPSRSDLAASRLKDIGEPAVPALIGALATDPNSQLWAARSLHGIGTPEANAAVEEWSLGVLATSDDALMWSSAALWLGRMKSEKAFVPVVEALYRHAEELRAWALVQALASVGATDAIEHLRRIVRDYKPDEAHIARVETYTEAAACLWELGDEEGLRALEDAADSPLPELQRSARLSLQLLSKRLGKPPAD